MYTLNDINFILEKLSKSKFRSSFHLKERELLYIKNKGFDIIEKHAFDFIDTRLKPCNLKNDVSQTPYHGHPVFVAQHATATCCRGCLNKWYKIPKDRNLNNEEVNFIIKLIMSWIKKEYK